MAESVPFEELDTGKKRKSCRYFKMTDLKDQSVEAINNIVKESINEKSIIFNDRSASFIDIEKYIEVHVKEKSTPKVTRKPVLPAYFSDGYFNLIPSESKVIKVDYDS